MTPTLILCAAVKNEAPYILEWIAYHRALGVTGFLIYDNESTDLTSELLLALERMKIAEVLPWPTVEGVSPQLSALNHAVVWLAGRASFVANIDVDEFLALDSETDLAGFLSGLAPDVGAVAISQRIFGSSGRLAYEPELVIERFQACAEDNASEHRFFKTLFRPSAVRRVDTSHSVLLKDGFQYVHADGVPVKVDGHPGKGSRVASGPIRVNHYILKSREEFENKRRRGGVAASTQAERARRYAGDWFFSGRDAASNKVPYQLSRQLVSQVTQNLQRLTLDALYNSRISIETELERESAEEAVLKEVYAGILWPGSLAINAALYDTTHTFALATSVGQHGEVIAIGMPTECIAQIRRRKRREGVNNIRLVEGSGPGMVPPVLDELAVRARVTFIRIDAGEHAVQILRGARGLVTRFRPLIALRVNPKTVDTWGALAEISDELGYRIIDLAGRQLGGDHWAKQPPDKYAVLFPSEAAYIPVVVRRARRRSYSVGSDAADSL